MEHTFINILFRKCMMFEINLLEVKKGFKYSHVNAEVTCNYGEWHLTSFNTHSKKYFSLPNNSLIHILPSKQILFR